MPHPAAPYRLGIVSTYLPRQCGLATYTADLREALGIATDDLQTVVVAIDRDGHEYGDEVVVTINQDQIEDYTAAADALRRAGVHAVLIQHEYGIFGGPDGSHIVRLAQALTDCGIPYLVTLHTVLSRPSTGQAAALHDLCAGAARVTVFTETARQVAIRTGIAAGHQLVVLPHGAPAAMRCAPDPATLRPELRALLTQLQGKPTLTTFGLLSTGKGIDIAIDALAEVVRAHPTTQYVVAGATHPEVKRLEGEGYREQLHAAVARLGLTGNVHFVDAFLALDELAALLHASTLFVTPYRSPEQICSGALTFALGAGLPAVSSDYSYAADMLAGGAGRVVPCGDRDALAAEITGLLGDTRALARAKAVAQTSAGWLQWPTVAAREAEPGPRRHHQRRRQLFGVGTGPGTPPRRRPRSRSPTSTGSPTRSASSSSRSAPSPSCPAATASTTSPGSRSSRPTCSRSASRPTQRRLAARWLRQSMRFLLAAHDPTSPVGAWHNVLSYSGTWQDEPHLGDHVGRAIWALGVLAAAPAVPRDIAELAGRLLDDAAPHLDALADVGLRSGAYALIGFARGGPGRAGRQLLRRLDAALTTTAGPDWYWFEPDLTYDNARLAQAMLLGAAMLGEAEARRPSGR